MSDRIGPVESSSTTAERAAEPAPSQAPATGGMMPAGISAGLWQRKLQRRRAESASTSAAPTSEVTGGLKPGAKKDPGSKEVLGGIGDRISDAMDVVGTAAGNVIGGIAGALTGVSISTTDTLAASWSPEGQFAWDVAFNTTGTDGWIVQQIVNTIHAEDSTGAAVNTAAVVPSYYEAWSVDAASVVQPSAGSTNDMWHRPAWGANTKGHWSMRGHVYFTKTDPAKGGLTPGGVSNAGILLSSVSAPPDLGVARQHRYAHGTWDATGGKNTHTGSNS